MPRQRNTGAATVADDEALPAVDSDAVHRLYRDLLDADRFDASSNDVAQLVDDWFVEQGFPTILYR